MELLVVLGLSACYYFLVRNFALGVGTDHTNYWVFAATGKSAFNLNALFDVWKGRLPGMLLSGSLFDLVGQGDSYPIDRYAMFFGLYQALWLLVLMMMMVVAVRHSLLVNLGIFAGLLYNFIPLAGFYFYPWDLPATVFLTLAVLLQERGHRVLMLAALGVGCLFKETVLVGAILCLFCREWKWRWRILSFVGLAAFYMLSKRYFVSSLHLKSAVLAMGDATNLRQLLRPDLLLINLKVLFSEKVLQVLFANAGTLLAVLVFGWEKRFRPYLWLIAAFVAGHLVYGSYAEVRIFMQVLPLSCLILCEYAYGQVRRSANAVGDPQPVLSRDDRAGAATSSEAASDWSTTTEAAWASRKNDARLTLIAVMLLVGTSTLVAWDYFAALQTFRPEYQAWRVANFKTAAQRGELEAQYALANRYYRGAGVAANLGEAFYWYREAADRGHIGAQLKLALCSLRGENTAQNYQESIRLFRQVAAQGNQTGQFYGGILYTAGLGLSREKVGHFQYLAWLGPLALAAAGLATVFGFVRKRKSMIDPALIVSVMLVAGTLAWLWRCGGIEPITALDPNYYLACEHLGYALSKTGQYDEAIAFLKKSIELQPGIPEADFNLGTVLVLMDRLDEAIAHFRKSVELRPRDPYAHNNLGVGLIKLGQLDEAIRQYQEALRLKPDFAEASNNLAGALRVKEASAAQPPASLLPRELRP